jgi:hypothetical protein
VEIWAFVFTVSPHLARTWFTLILNEYLTNEGKRKKPSAQNRSHWIEAGFSGELRLRWAVVDELGVYLVEKRAKGFPALCKGMMVEWGPLSFL